MRAGILVQVRYPEDCLIFPPVHFFGAAIGGSCKCVVSFSDTICVQRFHVRINDRLSFSNSNLFLQVNYKFEIDVHLHLY